MKKCIYNVTSFFFLLILGLLHSQNSICVSNQPQSQTIAAKKISLLSSRQGHGPLIAAITKQINQAKPKSKIIGSFWQVTHPTVKKSLNAAGKRGVNVELVVREQLKNKPIVKQFLDSNIAVAYLPHNHTKTIGFLSEDGNESIIFLGSKNPTQTKNKEIMVRFEGNKKSFEQLNQAIKEFKAEPAAQTGSPQKRMLPRSPIASSQSAFAKTPESTFILGGKYKGLSKTREQCIKNIEADDVITVATMNVGESLIEALQEAVKKKAKASLIINGTALKAHKDLLKKAQQSGVEVHVYNADESKKSGHFPLIMHEKFVLREKASDDSKLVIISTANFTPQGDSEPNIELYLKNKVDLYDELKSEADELIKISHPLNDAIKLTTVAQKEKNNKRKAAIISQSATKKIQKK